MANFFLNHIDTFRIVMMVGIPASIGISFILLNIFTKKAYGKDRKAKKILQTGESTHAKIIELVDQGIKIYNNPYVKLILEVYPKGKEAYQTELKTVIPRYNLPQFQAETMIKVTIDPEDPKNVVLGSVQEDPIAGDSKKAFENGEKAKAQLMVLERTSRKEGVQNVYRIKYKVMREGMEPYEVEKEVPSPDYILDIAVVGKTYNCLVNAMDKNNISVKLQS